MKARKKCLFFFLMLCLCLCNCGRGGADSVSVNNTESLSEDLRRTMINRSYALDVEFEAKTHDEDAARILVEDLIEHTFYESEDPKGGDYLRFQYGGCDMKQTVDRNLKAYSYSIRILPVYYTTAEEEAYVDEAVSSVVSDFYQGGGSSDYEKVCFVRDYICDTVTYDTVHKHTKGSGHIQYTAYAGLFYHTALCQGYSVLCYRLLKELGVDCRVVTGTVYVNGTPERHAWNIVNIDGLYYNLDVTMDDISESRDYFLKSYISFASDHEIDAEYLTEEFKEKYPISGKDYENE